MSLAIKMPETPDELEVFVRDVRDNQALELQRESLAELRQLSERQTRLEGRVEEFSHTVQLYRQDFHSLLERFDRFQAEVRTENEKFRQEMRAENEKFRQEMGAENEKFAKRYGDGSVRSISALKRSISALKRSSSALKRSSSALNVWKFGFLICRSL